MTNKRYKGPTNGYVMSITGIRKNLLGKTWVERGDNLKAQIAKVIDDTMIECSNNLRDKRDLPSVSVKNGVRGWK